VEARHRVCPVERAGHLDTRLRRLMQPPGRVLRPFVRNGMTVLDMGCGPGFFTLEMARRVGPDGKVIAVDLQEGMLSVLKEKIENTELEKRITLHQCDEYTLGVSSPIDFALMFYVLHEVADKDALFNEMINLLNPGGQILLVEPPLHVSRAVFNDETSRAKKAGFAVNPGPRLFFNHTAVLSLPA